MAPPVATETSYMPSVSSLKSQLNGSKTETNGLKSEAKQEILEDWSGNYQFAPIEEAEVSRAMIKRYAAVLLKPPRPLIDKNWAGTLTRCTSVPCRTLSSSAQALLDSRARTTSARQGPT